MLANTKKSLAQRLNHVKDTGMATCCIGKMHEKKAPPKTFTAANEHKKEKDLTPPTVYDPSPYIRNDVPPPVYTPRGVVPDENHAPDTVPDGKAVINDDKDAVQSMWMQRQTRNNVPSERRPLIIDNNSGTSYRKGKLLGKGGFARCYELQDINSQVIYAGKIVSKSRLTKPHQKEKILREVQLHRHLNHRNVVAFHGYFEDSSSVYMVLENCSRKSLIHVLKNRRVLTESEVRYFMRQLIDGCRYIHRQHVIHRDLKLGNMLLSEHMEVKIADFGLATRVEYEGEKKLTVCGTPNYIAPEVLQKKGHSYEADVWAMGCIMYALLCGRPPFETSSLKDTYVRIVANKFTIPSHVSLIAKDLICRFLHPDPLRRPRLDNVFFDSFFTKGYLPPYLPSSCCDTVPKFPLTENRPRPRSVAETIPQNEAARKVAETVAQLNRLKRSSSSHFHRSRERVMGKETEISGGTDSSRIFHPSVTSDSNTSRVIPACSAMHLYKMLAECLAEMPFADTDPLPSTNPRIPVWVTKWVDYSNKYGFGFQLSDGSYGLLYNDTTRMLLSSDNRTLFYNDLSNKIHMFNKESAPTEHKNKVTLLKYFGQYMDEHLIRGGDSENGNHRSRHAIFMKKWFRTGKAIVMHLSNGTLQVNFFNDHTKIILCPDIDDYIVIFINSSRQCIPYRLQQLRQVGCSEEIARRLRYTRKMLENIINFEGEAV